METANKSLLFHTWRAFISPSTTHAGGRRQSINFVSCNKVAERRTRQKSVGEVGGLGILCHLSSSLSRLLLSYSWLTDWMRCDLPTGLMAYISHFSTNKTRDTIYGVAFLWMAEMVERCPWSSLPRQESRFDSSDWLWKVSNVTIQLLGEETHMDFLRS